MNEYIRKATFLMPETRTVRRIKVSASCEGEAHSRQWISNASDIIGSNASNQILANRIESIRNGMIKAHQVSANGKCPLAPVIKITVR